MGVEGVFTNANDRRELAADEVLFHDGDEGASMFGVVSGTIELRRGDELVALVTEGGTFGELAILTGEPRTLTAVAAVPSEVVSIDEWTFLSLVQENPRFALDVMRSLAYRLRRQDKRG